MQLAERAVGLHLGDDAVDQSEQPLFRLFSLIYVYYLIRFVVGQVKERKEIVYVLVGLQNKGLIIVFIKTSQNKQIADVVVIQELESSSKSRYTVFISRPYTIILKATICFDVILPTDSNWNVNI